jgi:hypothetical protein
MKTKTKHQPPAPLYFDGVVELVPAAYVLFKRPDKRFVLKRHNDGTVIYSSMRLDRMFSRIMKLPQGGRKSRNYSARWNSFEIRNNRRIENARAKSQRMRMA